MQWRWSGSIEFMIGPSFGDDSNSGIDLDPKKPRSWLPAESELFGFARTMTLAPDFSGTSAESCLVGFHDWIWDLSPITNLPLSLTLVKKKNFYHLQWKEQKCTTEKKSPNPT